MANQSGCWNGATAGTASQRKAPGAPTPQNCPTVPAGSGATEPAVTGEGSRCRWQQAGTEPGQPCCGRPSAAKGTKQAGNPAPLRPALRKRGRKCVSLAAFRAV